MSDMLDSKAAGDSWLRFKKSRNLRPYTYRQDGRCRYEVDERRRTKGLSHAERVQFIPVIRVMSASGPVLLLTLALAAIATTLYSNSFEGPGILKN